MWCGGEFETDLNFLNLGRKDLYYNIYGVNYTYDVNSLY